MPGIGFRALSFCTIDMSTELMSIQSDCRMFCGRYLLCCVRNRRVADRSQNSVVIIAESGLLSDEVDEGQIAIDVDDGRAVRCQQMQTWRGGASTKVGRPRGRNKKQSTKCMDLRGYLINDEGQYTRYHILLVGCV